MSEKGGLGILGGGQLLLGSLPTDRREGEAERIIGLLEDLPRRGVRFRKRPAHADKLTPLPRKLKS